jgi:alpha-galactosidase
VAIILSNKEKTFTLHTKNTTYQFKVVEYGFLLHTYYGVRTENTDFSYLIRCADRGFCGNPYDAGNDRTFSLDALPQEFPCGIGAGDYRLPALTLAAANGTGALDLRYKSHKITQGKYILPGLPATYEEEGDECETLAVALCDDALDLEVELLYGVFSEKDIITRAAVVTNKNGKDVKLENICSASLDFLHGDFDLIHFHGRHAFERELDRTKLTHNIQTISSSRGTSSHQHNPGIILADSNANEDNGDCYGLNLVYSGNFSANAERGQIDGIRVNIGATVQWTLRPKESFYAPEAVMSFSDKGLSKLSQNYHKFYRHNLCRGKYKLSPRPILINNWEATYFDFDDEKLLQIAESAKEIGADMLVMDDGWFGERADDSRGLGDWFVNENKIKGGLRPLVDKVNALGLKFGIWFEPEMVSEDSDMYRENRNWVLKIPGRPPVRGRNQLVLNMSLQSVRDYLFDSISKVLDSANVEYVKWDMNRSISDWHSPVLSSQQQCELPHRYMQGVYELLERLTAKYPNVLFEGCSGGGGRFDAGMLYYHPQIWCSDNTDAINRIKIQYGTSFFYPISTVGSHVSAVPNHQTGRNAPLETRSVVAMSGSYGFELDTAEMSEEEKRISRDQVELFKKYQSLIHNGLYYRLTNPYENKGFTAWQFVSEDQKETLLNAVKTDAEGNPKFIYIKLKGLNPDKIYTADGMEHSGAALMNAGLCISDLKGEYTARQFFFKGE